MSHLLRSDLWIVRAAYAMGICLSLAAAAFAVGPQFWEFATQAELLKGKLEGVSLTSDGRIILAPRYEMVFNTEQAYLFSLTKDAQGNIYAGSGHEGKVFKINPKGEGKVIFQAKELDVFALAVDSQNNLYVGSSPEGKVYKINPSGEAREFFDPRDKYIWSLACDRSDNVYVATGGRGLIYKVNKDGEGDILFDSEDTHIVSLAIDSTGNILAGSSPNGYLYRIPPAGAGKAFVLYDSPLNEMRAVTIDRQGGVYVVALAESSSGTIESLPPASKPPTSDKPVISSASSEPAADTLETKPKEQSKPEVKVTPTMASPGKEITGTKSVIYRIRPDGAMETLWSSREDVVYALLVRDDGRLLAGTGTKGRILLLSPDRTATILVESPEEQVTALLADGEEIYAATSNLGKIFALKSQRAHMGYYESEVRDSKTLSSWGMISWRVENPTGKTIELYTRTGNTEKPDKTWSDWEGPYRNGEGEQIRSPRARYIQWKAVFRSDPSAINFLSITDALEKVTLAFLPQNLPPRVTAINILTPGIALQRMPVVPAPTSAYSASTTTASQPSSPAQTKPKFKLPPQQRQQPGAQAITWRAEDDNDDDLEYTLYFRSEGESDWKLLEKNLTDDFYTIDSNALPDGVYYVKVVASDVPSNPYDLALTGEITSRPFIIDNTPPSIEILAHQVIGRKVQIRLLAKDQASKITQAEFSIDGGQWRIIFPKDGIADAKTEEYEFSTPDIEPGEHTIAFRASDVVGNIGTNKVVVRLQN